MCGCQKTREVWRQRRVGGIYPKGRVRREATYEVLRWVMYRLKEGGEKEAVRVGGIYVEGSWKERQKMQLKRRLIMRNKQQMYCGSSSHRTPPMFPRRQIVAVNIDQGPCS